MPATTENHKISPLVLKHWDLTPVSFLGGRVNHHWLVKQKDQHYILRQYDDNNCDVEYELNVIRHLNDSGWPVPVAIDLPKEADANMWCLFTHLPGKCNSKNSPEEQHSRGRLLARLHDSLGGLNGLRQRKGFSLCDSIITDEGLTEAVCKYEHIKPQTGHMLRWHMNRARECFGSIKLDNVRQTVIHGDFTVWNLLYEKGELTGILDFEFTHLNYLVADFALSWRGCYDEVIKGYEEIQPLDDLDWGMLVLCFWAWLFIGVKDEINMMLKGEIPVHSFEWQTKLMTRRSPLFRELATPYRPNT